MAENGVRNKWRKWASNRLISRLLFLSRHFFNVQWQHFFSPSSPLVKLGNALQWPWVQIQRNTLLVVQQQPAIVRLRQMH